MDKRDIKGLLSSMLASKTRGLSGPDLEFLDIVFHTKKGVPVTRIKQYFPRSDAVGIVRYLAANYYIKRGSPRWVLTKKGKDIIVEAHAKKKDALNLINSDSFLYSLAEASGTFK